MTDRVSIIGASVAGLYAGYHLAQARLPVTIYEARQNLTPPPRTLIVTSEWLRLLDFDAEPVVLNRVSRFQLIAQAESASVRLSEPDVILERQRFVELLSDRVAGAGGTILPGHRLGRIAQDGTGCELHIENGSGTTHASSRRVLGADGIDTTAAQILPDHRLDAVALLQVRVPLPPDLDADTVRVVFDREATRFFFWLIPESATTAVAGLIHDTPEEAQESLDRFLSDQDLEPIGQTQEARVPMAPIQLTADSHAGDDRLMLVGDAAAQVKTTTVGGVVTGMRGARAAARSILNGTSYAHELRPLRRELNAHSLLRAILDGFTDEDYDRLLRLLNQGASQILSEHTRDELARGLWWRLIRAQPRWAALSTQALLRRLA